MEIVVDSAGNLRHIYDEAIDLAALGQRSIRRASTVEPNAAGEWFADLSPVAGPRLGPFILRSQALAAEQAWLTAHWLSPVG